MANELPASYDFEELKDRRPVFTREYIYENGLNDSKSDHGATKMNQDD